MRPCLTVSGQERNEAAAKLGKSAILTVDDARVRIRE